MGKLQCSCVALNRLGWPDRGPDGLTVRFSTSRFATCSRGHLLGWLLARVVQIYSGKELPSGHAVELRHTLRFLGSDGGSFFALKATVSARAVYSDSGVSVRGSSHSNSATAILCPHGPCQRRSHLLDCRTLSGDKVTGASGPSPDLPSPLLACGELGSIGWSVTPMTSFASSHSMLVQVLVLAWAPFRICAPGPTISPGPALR
jgi:hypothetical protein